MSAGDRTLILVDCVLFSLALVVAVAIYVHGG